jgi:peptidoglycan/LPS O-acetylase OafA/YrhL
VSGQVAALVGSGARGVQLFYIISAFTLFSTSLQRFPKEPNPRRSFYLRRAFRILPLWWIAAILYVAIGPMGTSGPVPEGRTLDFVLHATFLFGFSPDFMNSLVPGGWSLFCEETFYLLLPLLYARLGSLVAAARLALALLGLSVSWYVLGRLVGMRVPRLTPEYVFMFPFSQWFIFAEGILLFHLLRLPAAKNLDRPIALLVDCSTLILLWIALAGHAPGPAHFSAAVAFFALFFAMAQPRSLLRRVFDNAVLRAFGQCCYSIYLFHFWLLRVSAPYVRWVLDFLGLSHANANVQLVSIYALFAIVCLAFGMCSFHLFEKPLVALGRRVIRRLNTVGATTMPGST